MSAVFPESPLSSPPEVWSDACAPGGMVCAVPDPGHPAGICGMPVESEPCDQHDDYEPGSAGIEVTHDPEIPVRFVRLSLCDLCLAGEGGECHVPGCSLWLNRAPDLPVRGNPGVTVLDAEPEPPATATPGQAAYEAHAAMVVPRPWRWDQLDGKLRAAWEAAAQAVLNQAFPGLKRERDEARSTMAKLATEVARLRELISNAGLDEIADEDAAWREAQGL